MLRVQARALADPLEGERSGEVAARTFAPRRAAAVDDAGSRSSRTARGCTNSAPLCVRGPNEQERQRPQDRRGAGALSSHSRSHDAPSRRHSSHCKDDRAYTRDDEEEGKGEAEAGGVRRRGLEREEKGEERRVRGRACEADVAKERAYAERDGGREGRVLVQVRQRVGNEGEREARERREEEERRARAKANNELQARERPWTVGTRVETSSEMCAP